MRVLLVNDYEPDSGPIIGGCEVVVRTLRDALRARGHDVAVFSGTDAGGLRTFWNYVRNKRAERALADRLHEFRPEVVHFHNIYHRLSPYVLGVPRVAAQGAAVVMTAHDGHLACPNPTFTRFGPDNAVSIELGSHRWTESEVRGARWDHRGPLYSGLRVQQHLRSYRRDRLHEHIGRVICPSRFLEDVLHDGGLPTEHVPPPVERQSPGTQSRPSDGPLRLVFAGRLEREKGLEAFLRAAPADGSWRLDVYGVGDEAQKLRAIAPGATFHGHVSHGKVCRAIASSHVLIATSLCPENAPAAVLEAASSGTAVLGGNLGGTPEIVQETGCGVVVDPFDGNSIANGLGELMARRYADRLNAFDASEYFAQRTPERHAMRVEAVYHGLLEGAAACAS
ncbi:MAG: glycosyltransferase [Planctomycetota bacterium]